MSATCGAMVTSRRMMPRNLATRACRLGNSGSYIIRSINIEHLWLCKFRVIIFHAFMPWLYWLLTLDLRDRWDCLTLVVKGLTLVVNGLTLVIKGLTLVIKGLTFLSMCLHRISGFHTTTPGLKPRSSRGVGWGGVGMRLVSALPVDFSWLK